MMFGHLLVPLDGSHLAEAALPAVSHIARVCKSEITLIHIIERDAPKEIHGERHLTSQDEALAYLTRIANRIAAPGIQIEKHVHTEEVSNLTRSIVEHSALEICCDLIVLCAHGRSGLHNWMFGSIAQQVIARGSVPVMVIQPTESGDAPPFLPQHLLVPLDGEPEHERGLTLAEKVARAFGASLHLVMVVPTLGTLSGAQAGTARLLPGTTSVLLDITEESASDYLEQHAARLEASGLPVTWSVKRGDPADGIVEAAGQVGAGLIVMGTHGKTGTHAFWAGSIAPKVSARSRLPILLVRAHEETGDS
jgi:nucleotide-binding universal stress UspA family protein